jgi:hypothetical protein
VSPCSSPNFRQDCRKNSTVRLGQSPFNVNGWMKGRTDGWMDNVTDGWKASFRPRHPFKLFLNIYKYPILRLD